MAGSGKNLINRQLAAHLASGMTYAEAGDKVGVCERTVRRRMQNPKFRNRVERLKDELVRQAVARLSDTMNRAASKLASLIDSKDDKIALGASKSVLELSLKARQAEEIEKKIEDLTERIERLAKAEAGHAGDGED